MWLKGGQWLDLDSGAFRVGDLRIKSGRIAEIGAALSDVDAVDMEGRYLLPGFIDNHVHITIDTTMAANNALWANALPGTIALHAAWNGSAAADVRHHDGPRRRRLELP